MSLDSIIRAVQKIMRKDSGVDGDAQRISQLVWMIFLKVFDSKEEEWELMDNNYRNIIPEHLQWRNWASNDEGITGDELIEFVNNKLFKELKELEVTENDNPKRMLVRSIFEDSFNYMKSGTLLRSVINKLNDEIDFSKQSERHLFNEIYETILRDLQSAGNAGEFYTPRAVTKFMVDIIDPKLGEKVLDFACGTGGFLVSSIEKLKAQIGSIEDMNIIQDSILGIEKKPLPYMLSVTNLILHDIDNPQIKHDNSLAINIRGIKQKDKIDIIVANPPFGGTEESSVMVNFPKNMQSEETSDLFLVLLANKLKESGRAAIVLPDGFLSGDSSTKVAIKEMLLEKMNLHTIVRLPIGVFSPYAKGVKTNLLFFQSGKPTKEIWYFEHPLPENYSTYTKTKPIEYDEFMLEKNWWKERVESKYSWKIDIQDVQKANYNLDFRNPNKTAIDFSLSKKSLDEKIRGQQKEINSLLELFLKE